jgi:hypothetical protein
LACIIADVPTLPDPQRIASLWQLCWQENRLTCAIYRDVSGRMELRIESPTAVILAEAFEVQPRALARAQALRESLKRRGWEEPGHDLTPDAQHR